MKWHYLLGLTIIAVGVSGCFKTVVVRSVVDVRDPIPRDSKAKDDRQDSGHPAVDSIRPERKIRKK